MGVRSELKWMDSGKKENFAVVNRFLNDVFATASPLKIGIKLLGTKYSECENSVPKRCLAVEWRFRKSTRAVFDCGSSIWFG